MAIYINGKRVISAYVDGKQSDVLYVGGKRVFVDGDFIYEIYNDEDYFGNIRESAKIIFTREASDVKKTIIIPDTTIINNKKYVVRAIGDEVFFGNTSLQKIVLNDYITQIGRECFKNCTSLKYVSNIPNTLVYIGESAFNDENNKTLSNLITHDYQSVSYLGSNDETNCVALVANYTETNDDSGDKIILHNNTNIIYERAFKDRKKLASISGGNYTLLRQIGKEAFSGCTLLSSINGLNSSVTSYGRACFNGTALETFSLNYRVKELPGNIFGGCTELRIFNFNTPSSVTRIDSYAFWRCTSLTNIVIPDNVTKLGENPEVDTARYGFTFYGCSGLTSITIPRNINTIWPYTFAECGSLKTINYKGTKEEWGKIEKKYSWKYNVPTDCIVSCTDGEINI